MLNLALCWQDQQTGLLPDRLTCPLLWSGLLYALCLHPTQLADAVWGAIVGYVAFASIYWLYRGLRHREGLGYGDVKYLAALGAWHGWQQLPILVFMAAGFACLLIAGKSLWRWDKTTIKNPLPFGPFLAAAGFILMGYQNLFFHFNL